MSATPYNTRSTTRRDSITAMPPSSIPPQPLPPPLATFTPDPHMLDADDMDDSDDDQMPRTAEKRSGRRKIRIEYIEDKSRRHITFSKRKAGIMKKVDADHAMFPF